MNTIAPMPPFAPGEWIRIYAIKYALLCPHVSAEEAVSRAIREFNCSKDLTPEEAATRRALQ